MRYTSLHRILLIAALVVGLPVAAATTATTRADTSAPFPKRPDEKLKLHVDLPSELLQLPKSLKDLGFWAGVQSGATWTALALIVVYLLFHQRPPEKTA
jgi:hypothetical protein